MILPPCKFSLPTLDALFRYIAATSRVPSFRQLVNKKVPQLDRASPQRRHSVMCRWGFIPLNMGY